MNKYLLLGAFFVFVMLAGSVSATNINSCTNIISSGSYYLTADIINSTTSPCMNISANDVTLDCQGHTIDGNDATYYGIYIHRGSSTNTNVTVKNCIVTDWGYGIHLSYSNSNNITNITANSNYQGITLSNSNSNNITNITVNSNEFGIGLYSSDSSTITDITVNSNYYGIYLENSDSSTLTNTIANYNTLGISLSNSNSNNLTNITANSNSQGVHLSSSDSSTLTNITANSNEFGISLYSSNSNTFTNVFSKNNTKTDFYLEAGTASYCTQTLTNVNGTDNKPILFYNSTVNISNWDNNVSEIILCNADNSIIDNLTLNREDTANNGLFLTGNTENTIISNSEFNNTYYGIHLSYSNSNNITNITANSNTYGIYLYNSNSNNLTNITANSNSQGIYLYYANSNTISSSRIENNSYGIHLDNAGSSSPNKIYNNLLNQTTNVYFSGTEYTNYWNTTNQTGTRIYSAGTHIGGNYWTNPSGTGYSDTCTDSDANGFCDDYYDVKNDTSGCDSNNCDYLPLSDEYTLNQAPILALNNTYPDIAYTTNDLKFNITCTDDDAGDTLTGYLQVYNGSNPYSSVQSSVVSNNTETTLFTLGSGNTTKGETWTGEYWCGDGTSNSSKSNDSVTISNSLPATPTTLTVNQTIYVAQNLTGSCSGSTDVDAGDSITYYYRFYNENDAGEVKAYSTDDYYTLQTTDAHDVINVTCKAYDGTSYSSGNVSNITTIDNSVPSSPDIGLNASISVGETLTVTCENSTDTDSDALTYYSEIYNVNDSATVKSYSATHTYLIQSTDAHDLLRARCKAGDGYDNSTESEANITVSNTAPTQPDLSLNTTITVTRLLEFTCENSTDADNDAITYYAQVYNVNDTFIKQNYSTTMNYTIASTDAHDKLRVRCRANDGIVNSTESEANITVSDTAPTTPTDLSLNSTIYVGQNLTGVCSGSTDVDGDAITYHYRFYNINDSAIVQNYSSSDKYLITTSDAHEIINVTCIATTSLANSTGNYSNTKVVNNSIPSVPNLVSPPNGATITGETIYMTWDASTDTDDDLITYYLSISTTPNPTGTWWNGTGTNSGSYTTAVGTTYYWRLRSGDGYDNSSYSSEYSFTRTTTATSPGGGGSTGVYVGETDLGIETKDCDIRLPTELIFTNRDKVRKLTIINKEDFSITPKIEKLPPSDDSLIDASKNISIVGQTNIILPDQSLTLSVVVEEPNAFKKNAGAIIRISTEICNAQDVNIIITPEGLVTTQDTTSMGDTLDNLKNGMNKSFTSFGQEIRVWHITTLLSVFMLLISSFFIKPTTKRRIEKIILVTILSAIITAGSLIYLL